MNYKQIFLLICLIACILFTVSSVFAGDVDTLNSTDCENESVSQEIQTEGYENSELTAPDGSDVLSASVVYFDASALNDYGDGSKSNPYKYYKSSRISYGTTAYFADGVYETNDINFIYSDSSYKTTFIGQSRDKTILKSGQTNRFDFSVKSGSYLVLKDLTMQNIHINNQANLEATNVVFRDTIGFEEKTRPGLYNSYIYRKYNSTCGGVIICDTPSNKVTTLNLNDCYFINNKASSGGAIATYKSIVNIQNCVFYNSSSERFGGAIYSLNSDLNITDTYFELSNAKYGGVIYGNVANITLNNNIFNLSQAYSFGGVIAFNSSQLDIYHCLFNDYASLTDAGGAIYAFMGAVNVFNSDFRYGKAYFGGAVCNLKSNFLVRNTEFLRNTATYYGGTIYNIHGSIIINGNNFTDSHSWGGGAVFSGIPDSLYVTNNLFLNSTAMRGDMILVDGDSSKVVESGNIYKNLYNILAVYNTKVNGEDAYFASNYLTYSIANDGVYVVPVINGETTPSYNYDNVNFRIYDRDDSSQVIYSDSDKIHYLKFDLTKYGSNFSDGTLEVYVVDEAGDILFSDGISIASNKNYASQKLLDLNFIELMRFLKYENMYNINFDSSVHLFNYSATSPTSLPSSYDSRDYGYITPVKDQKDGGNCWAFSGIATLEACIKKATGITYDLSEENVKNLMAEYSLFGSDAEINNGGNLYMFIAYLASWFGPVYDAYDTYDDYSSLSIIYDSIFHVQNVYVLPDRENSFDNDLIKKAIMEFGAVSIAAPWNTGWHAVTLVGWDDEYTGNDYFEQKSTGAWIFKNSWGEDWNYNGYDYLSYEHHIESVYTFVLNDTNPYSSVYQYDYAGRSTYLIWNSGPIYYKNKFFANNDEILSAFSTYFYKPTDYTVSVYLNGKLVTTQNGHSSTGYYTIPFKNEIPLSAGDEFVIQIKTSNNLPISKSDALNRISYDRNISFFSLNGYTWTDLYDYSYTSGGKKYECHVACIKAFTRLKSLKDIKINVDSFDDVLVNTKLSINVDLPEYYIESGRIHYLDGLMTFIINGQYYYAKVENGKACLNISFDTVGSYDFSAQYRTNREISNLVRFTFNVVKTVESKISLQSMDISKFYGGPERYVVTVMDNGKVVSGASVKINVDGKSVSATTNSYGVASVDLNLGPGTYFVTAEYGGQSCSSKFTVISTISVSESTGRYLDSYVSASLLNTNGDVLSGRQVTFKVGDKTFKATSNSNGVANAYIDLDVGNYTVTVTNPVSGEQKQSNLLIERVDSKCLISCSQSGSTVTINATVSPIQATGEVYFVVNEEFYNVKVENGVALLKINLDPNDYSVTALYSGDGNFRVSSDSKTFTVLNTPKKLFAYNLGWTYDCTEVKAEVYGPDNIPIEGETVKVTILNNTFTITTNSEGVASKALTLPVGSYPVVYECGGQSLTREITVYSTIDISDNACTYLNSQISASFIYGLNCLKDNINVKFLIGDNQYTATTNANGVASVNVDLPAGTYTVTAVNLASGEQKQAKLIINKANPTITISKSQSGNVVTLTANLNPKSVTGNVVFNVGGKKYTSSIVNGKATATISNLVAGSYDAYANFAGDNNFYNAISSSVAITIENTDIVLSAPDFTKYYGGSERFTVTLTGNNNPIRGETVKLIFGSKTYNMTTNYNGIASIGVNLSPGSYVFKLIYNDKTVSSKVTVKSTISLEDMTFTYGDVKPTATFYDASGNPLKNEVVSFKVDTKQYNVTTNGKGVATFTFTDVPDLYILRAVNPVSGEEKSVFLTINKITPVMTLDGEYLEDQSKYVLNATFTPNTLYGNIVFTFNGKDYEGYVVNGKAIFTMTDYDAGSYPISVKFVGDDCYSSVSKSFTAVIIDNKPVITAKPLTIKYGSKTPFIVKATDSSGNPLEGKMISMEFWGANTWEYYYVDDTPTGNDGTVIIYLNGLIPDTYEVVISHIGVKDVISKVVVKKLTPKLTAYNKAFKVKTKTKKFSVILKTDKGKAMKNVKLTIKVKGKTYSAKTSSNGKATFKITKLNARGSFIALVKFAGTKYYAAVSKKVKITVKK